MTTHYSSRKSALEAAKQQSIDNPGIGYFVNWVEANEWEINIEGELLDQEFYLNGQLIVPDWS